MDLTVANTEIEKPRGRKATGRAESPQWTELTEKITKQKPGVWTTYAAFVQTPDAVRVGTRLRQAENFEAGKAFAPLAGKVKVAIVDTGTALVFDEKLGKKVRKKIATLSIRYGEAPKTVRKTVKKS